MLGEPAQTGLVPLDSGVNFRRGKRKVGRGRFNLTKIDKSSRSMAVSMAFRAPDRTLSSEEVGACVEQVIARLSQALGAELRSQ